MAHTYEFTNDFGVRLTLKEGQKRSTRTACNYQAVGEDYPPYTPVTVIAPKPDPRNLTPRPEWVWVRWPNGAESRWPATDLLTVAEAEQGQKGPDVGAGQLKPHPQDALERKPPMRPKKP